MVVLGPLRRRPSNYFPPWQSAQREERQERRTTNAGILVVEFSLCHLCKSRNGQNNCGLLRFDVGRPDHLAPLLGLIGEELAKLARCECKHGASRSGETCFHLG